MSERHDRSVRAAVMMMLGYAKEIQSLIVSGDDFHSSLKGRPTAEEADEIDTILSGIERDIEEYWGRSGMPQEETDVKWRIYLLSQFMEDLVDDMHPERLNKRYGNIESEEQAKRVGELCKQLDGQIRRLKDISSK